MTTGAPRSPPSPIEDVHAVAGEVLLALHRLDAGEERRKLARFARRKSPRCSGQVLLDLSEVGEHLVCLGVALAQLVEERSDARTGRPPDRARRTRSAASFSSWRSWRTCGRRAPACSLPRRSISRLGVGREPGEVLARERASLRRAARSTMPAGVISTANPSFPATVSSSAVSASRRWPISDRTSRRRRS